MDSPKISIIIPVYNGAKDIIRCLDSIYSQHLDSTQFEVLCIDDCSTDNTAETITRYSKNKNNLRLISHSINKRQGGGRNTGVNQALGNFILFIDHDDYFAEGSLLSLIEYQNKFQNADILMFDFSTVAENQTVKSDHYSTNSSQVMSGRFFMQEQEVPWVPWCYLYKRTFLQQNRLRFEEQVRFEDADFVIKCTIAASSIIFVPLVVICHTQSTEQTTHVGNDSEKIIDLFKLSDRVKQIAIHEMDVDAKCAEAIMGHHLFRHKYNILRYLWRVPFSKMLYILRHYKAYTPNNNAMLTFSAKHPLIFAILLQMMKPVLPILRKIYMSSR